MARQQRRRMLAVVTLSLVGTFAVLVTTPEQVAAANPFHLFSLLRGKCGDVHSYECDECGRIECADKECIIRRPIHECIVGKKKVFNCKIKCEYVSIPETRYRWKKRCITEEIPCPYCPPVCSTEEGRNCFGAEKWDKFPIAARAEDCSCDGAGVCAACQELHCRHIVPQIEKTEIKCCQQGSCEGCCQHAPGETTVKVKYWSCVKEPYTVYRRVKRPICVKQPCYELAEVPITRYVCEHCDGAGCHSCSSVGSTIFNATGCTACDGAGCDQCTGF